jgi:hypothetical protein
VVVLQFGIGCLMLAFLPRGTLNMTVLKGLFGSRAIRLPQNWPPITSLPQKGRNPPPPVKYIYGSNYWCTYGLSNSAPIDGPGSVLRIEMGGLCVV